VETLHILGVPALLEGNIIHLAHSELFVAQACSGLRSLMALLTLGVVFSYFLQRGAVRRVIIVASTIPIAIFVNAVRVTLTGVLAHAYGQEAATGFIHDFQGLITFFLAFLVLLAEARLITLIAPSVEFRGKLAEETV
jgi:exosortase